MIVVNSFKNLYSTPMDGEGEPRLIDKSFALEINYAYIDKDRNGANEYFLIDVSSLDNLEEYLNSVIEAKDVAQLKSNIIHNQAFNE